MRSKNPPAGASFYERYHIVCSPTDKSTKSEFSTKFIVYTSDQEDGRRIGTREIGGISYLLLLMQMMIYKGVG